MITIGILYLRVNHGEHDEGKEVLDAEDQDREGVLHVGMGPDLNTHGVAGPGKVDGLDCLEKQNG